MLSSDGFIEPVINFRVCCLLSSMGDGIIFPQRHMDEDEDSLLGARQRWMEEGGPLEADNSGDVTSPYRKDVITLSKCLNSD